MTELRGEGDEDVPVRHGFMPEYRRFAVIGLIGIFVGFVVELYGQVFCEWLFQLGGKVPSHWVIGDGHGLSLVGVTSLLAKEAGVAFVVAWIITNGVEVAARKRDNDWHQRVTTETAKSVIHGLYALRHDKNFVKAVLETNLEANIVREKLTLDYKLRPLTSAERQQVFPVEPDRAGVTFVMLEAKSTYRFRNVSSMRQLIDIQYQIPLRHGEGARRVSHATYVQFNKDHPLKSEEISAAMLSLDHEEEIRYCWPRTLDSGGFLGVTILSKTLKEKSDSETWGSFFPTMGEIVIRFKVLDRMVSGVRPLSNGTMEEQLVPEELQREWILYGPILKHNSLVFYWRTPEDDARIEETTGRAVQSVFGAQLEEAEATGDASANTETAAPHSTFRAQLGQFWNRIHGKILKRQ